MTGWKQQPYQQTKNYVGKYGFSENWTHPIRMAGEIWSNPKAYSNKKEDQPHYNKVTGEIEGRVPVVPHKLDPGYGKAVKDKEFIDEKDTHACMIQTSEIRTLRRTCVMV